MDVSEIDLPVDERFADDPYVADLAEEVIADRTGEKPARNIGTKAAVKAVIRRERFRQENNKRQALEARERWRREYSTKNK